MLNSTHTFAELALSPAAYDEIAEKLKAAGYHHSFCGNGAIDMHGIGITRETPQITINATWESDGKPRTGVTPPGHTPETCWMETGSAS